jgi:FlaA1/EpsC-like NDP-sugar epimerase
VLITGGGGSIGSELCMQAAACGAEKLVILDINENNAFAVRERLAWEHPALHAVIEIASVRDAGRMRDLMKKHRPQLVIHAAAHKHVPLMEACPWEAIKNNIFGTLHAADAAEEAGAARFVLISTDKAVNPSCVMGMTKRFCEYIIASRRDSATHFSAVRFGNVLGSAGSVVPSFIHAIRRGETVRIFDRQAERYFMTIPEAARLVLRTAAFEERGVYVLDMGEAISIAALAKRVGDCLGLPVNMEFSSLRGGEKLREELFYGEPTATEDPLIFMERQPAYTREDAAHDLALLGAVQDDDTAVQTLRKIMEA